MYFSHLCNLYHWKRMIIPVIYNEIRSRERRKWRFRESNFKNFPVGRSMQGACPQPPPPPRGSSFGHSLLKFTCFTYESGTLKCYRIPWVERAQCATLLRRNDKTEVKSQQLQLPSVFAPPAGKDNMPAR